uniref:ornithine carbamoyltransferase n=1 Tax=Chromera velia CCMP2878 TaxID=1169474 RepID=A0A0G4GG04_9ALVE|eukprot:Cvel_21721.t1-p1 / transcript=Cvel_21721.t1 / gene=Cvel_21721 / organism=Chromera_velia_CCMP2878 / gene_product=Ornithine carbamoyltransferase, putative / transcript_product=Ornithine carbamoyltransferase, putative / location=Cvel_scaffold2061:20440-24210(+) / protein_length=412 / sequence_SO=supercontig / SO=protein_coding / is_pseudo=false
MRPLNVGLKTKLSLFAAYSVLLLVASVSSLLHNNRNGSAAKKKKKSPKMPHSTMEAKSFCPKSMDELKRSPLRQQLKGKSLLTLLDFSPEEIWYLIELSAALKRRRKTDRQDQSTNPLLQGMTIALIFEKDSTRTRCAFEVSSYDEGMHCTRLDGLGSHFGKKESVEDTAKVLGRFYDCIQFRGSKQTTVEMLSEHSGVPVFNGLTGEFHPSQAIADVLTMAEHWGIASPEDVKGKKVCYVGDARNNVAVSLAVICAKLGMHWVGVAPEELFLGSDMKERLDRLCEETGGSITLSTSDDAVEGADVIYTDVWVSMGEEDLFEKRIKLLQPYQVDSAMMEATGKPDTLFMHCLPAFHDLNTAVGVQVYEGFGLKELEVTDEVFRSPQSVVFDQAENRLHTTKAIIVAAASPVF